MLRGRREAVALFSERLSTYRPERTAPDRLPARELSQVGMTSCGRDLASKTDMRRVVKGWVAWSMQCIHALEAMRVRKK